MSTSFHLYPRVKRCKQRDQKSQIKGVVKTPNLTIIYSGVVRDNFLSMRDEDISQVIKVEKYAAHKRKKSDAEVVCAALNVFFAKYQPV